MGNKFINKLSMIVLICIVANLVNGQTISNDSIRVQYEKIKQANIEAAAKANIIHFVMKNDDGSYGYSIFVDGILTYHQPNVPAISGNKGFVKIDHAEAAANLAIQKIKEGESPPTLSVKEINNIIINN